MNNIRHAVIKIGGEVVDTPDTLKQLVRSLGVLQSSGLKPIVIHGAGPQMNQELENAGIEPNYIQGMRVTTSSTLAIARNVFLKANRTLVDALTQAGLPSRPITNGVFEAKLKDYDNLGFVGQVTEIYDDSIQSALQLNQIPVLSCMGESESGQALNINADVAARQLSMKLKPDKTIFITAKGGWIDDDGTKLDKIVMEDDYERMAGRDYEGRQGTLLKLNEIKTLLDTLPPTSSVVLTSAGSLAKEILPNARDGTVCTKSHLQVPLHQSSKRYKVGLLGARGYVGREVIRLLAQHPEFELICASSRALEGQHVATMAASAPLNPHTQQPASVERIPERFQLDDTLSFCNLTVETIKTDPIAQHVDVWMLALPNGHSAPYIKALTQDKKQHRLIIDLSADHRFTSDWVYGLPELPGTREKLRRAEYISNPGCYATSGQLALLPLVSSNALTSQIPTIFGVSGYSGAGTGLSDNNNLSVLQDNLIGYKPVDHIHEREMSRHLQTRVAFMPHVAPFFRGIHITASMQLKDPTLNVAELYRDFYQHDQLVQVSLEIPKVRDNAYGSHVQVGGFAIDETTGRVVIYSTIDNLLKGAATQAVQNMNLALDLPEYS